LIGDLNPERGSAVKTKCQWHFVRREFERAERAKIHKR